MASKNKFYGNASQYALQNEEDKYLEEINVRGFTLIDGFLDDRELETIRNKVDLIYNQQEKDLGRDLLAEIQELNIARALLAYDSYFVGLVTRDKILGILKKLLGDYFILNLQNAIISVPGQEHHQNTWHRDLPYQNFVISRPIAVNVFFCIDEFDLDTGATEVVPGTHKMESLPSNEYIDNHKVVVKARPGSVVVFDSMLLHRAGYNSSNKIRRGINHIFSVPIMKQQYDFPAMLKGRFSEDPLLSRILGYDSQVPRSVNEWRMQRKQKLEKRNKK